MGSSAAESSRGGALEILQSKLAGGTRQVCCEMGAPRHQ